MKVFKECLLYILTGSFILAVSGAWIGLFFGVAWNIIKLVV